MMKPGNRLKRGVYARSRPFVAPGRQPSIRDPGNFLLQKNSEPHPAKAIADPRPRPSRSPYLGSRDHGKRPLLRPRTVSRRTRSRHSRGANKAQTTRLYFQESAGSRANHDAPAKEVASSSEVT